MISVLMKFVWTIEHWLAWHLSKPRTVSRDLDTTRTTWLKFFCCLMVIIFSDVLNHILQNSHISQGMNKASYFLMRWVIMMSHQSLIILLVWLTIRCTVWIVTRVERGWGLWLRIWIGCRPLGRSGLPSFLIWTWFLSEQINYLLTNGE